MITVDQLVAALDLKPLPREGGYYRETYRSPLSTAIYFLLTPDTCSALHRLPEDEVYHFYRGDPVELLLLEEGVGGRVVTLGPDVLGGQSVQAVVRGGVWQGSVLRDGGRFALLGTTMAPAFEFADYEAGDRGRLVAVFPEFAERITRLTAAPENRP